MTIALNESKTLCRDIAPHLAALNDGELRGEWWAVVSRHLTSCDRCAAEAEELASLGELVRSLEPPDEVPADLSGLAELVTARIDAESRSSWRDLWERAVDGWHWTVVGGGSLVGTLATTALLFVVVQFGPRPANQESIASFMTNMGTPPGYVFAFVSAEGEEAERSVWQVDNGLPVAPRVVMAMAERPSLVTHEAALVRELAETVAPELGGAVGRLTAARRARADALLDEIMRIRLGAARRNDVAAKVTVHEVRLVTSVTVKMEI